ncbi:hypothetical protein SISNIDRAFT_315140 [Sistotremastrum niveocremeum HHB9708]|uniref:Peptidase C14 caspase domain-containing protein n=1 Tax=Sistotremastrum niveocremeum HHB9708 TaxID=1314777 RepID=A0A164XZM1_9AGAM|nr:hypothetical protein SISNIDRAFT_315140 [Sistotremastrum niveocremeum HHB9708]
MDDSEVALPSAVSQPLPTTIFENIDDKLKEKVIVDEVSQIGKPEEQAASGGRKRALLVAFNYEARKEEGVPLLGTHRDAERVGRLLQDRFGYAKQDIIFIFDKGSYPNRGELLHKLKDFVSEARAGDQLFFYFAGHGDQVQSFTGTETDGFNERLLLPADPVGESAGSDVGSKEHSSDDKSIKLRREILDHRISKAGVTDNNLNKILVGNLPSGCRLTALIDACNSGTMLDLPHHHCNRLMIPDSKDDLHRSVCREESSWAEQTKHVAQH